MGAAAIQLQSAQLLTGPLGTVDGTQFPSGSTSTPLSLLPQQKPYLVTTGDLLFNINSPSAFTPLGAIGTSGPVTQAHTLYLRSQSPMQIKITYLGDATSYITYLYGLMLLEIDPSHPITAVQVQGAGQLEALAVGNA